MLVKITLKLTIRRRPIQVNHRLEKLAGWLKHEQMELAMIQDPANLFYLTGFECEPHERLIALFAFPGEEPFMILPKMEMDRLKDSGWTYGITAYEDTDNPWDAISSLLDDRKLLPFQSAAVEPDHLSYARAQSLLRLSPEAKLISISSQLEAMRAVKDETEIQSAKKAARFADMAVETGIEALKPGCTELEVVARIEYEMKGQGIREMSFSTMVLFGEKSGDPHGIPGTRRLQEGDLVLFDLGVIVEGYASDITRTVAFGSISEEANRIYETVRKAQEAALAQCRPQTPMMEVDRAARRVIGEAGYGAHFPHRIGHGLGISTHEYPSLHGNNSDLLSEGMIITVEPGIYVPGIGGVRIEDDLVITAEGHQVLTRFPKELQIVK
ncbi:xaa-Pro dipeptidase [Desmospora sp. 8437]|nr:xaa-Pro dipeptidase [Desmospora sp. 8437]